MFRVKRRIGRDAVRPIGRSLSIFTARVGVCGWPAAVVLGDLPISRTPQLDSAVYVNWAKEIVNDPAFWPEYPEHAPGYPMFVALILSLSGGSVMAVRVVQAILGAIACVLTARVASRTVTSKAFLPAGLLQAAYAPLIYVETALLSEALLVFLLIAALDLMTTAYANRTRWLIGRPRAWRRNHRQADGRGAC